MYSSSLEYDWELQSVNPLGDSEGWKHMERYKLFNGWNPGWGLRRPDAFLILAQFSFMAENAPSFTCVSSIYS